MQQRRVTWAPPWPLGRIADADIGDYPGVYLSNHTYAETVPMNRKVVPMQFGRGPVSSSKCQWRHAQVPLH